jgi:hypothetical protein
MSLGQGYRRNVREESLYSRLKPVVVGVVVVVWRPVVAYQAAAAMTLELRVMQARRRRWTV